MNINDLTRHIEKWAMERKLHQADPDKQILKLGEEFRELCQGKAKNKYGQVVGSIGDMYVVLTILALQLGLNIEEWYPSLTTKSKTEKEKW